MLHPANHPIASCVVAAILALSGSMAMAADAPAKPTAKAAKPAKAAPAPKEAPLPAPTPEQQKAAELVYYGPYECEFNQTVSILASPAHLFYVDVKHGNSSWLMKPVLSPTGAVRLEDVRGETLMVQIASKSMLLNTKTGRRIVDACVSPRQRELMQAAKAAESSGGGTVLLSGGASPSGSTPASK